MLSCYSCVPLFETPWTIACQAPLSLGSSRQAYWNRFPFPSPGDLPNPRMEPTSFTSPALAGGFFTTTPTWEAPTVVYIRLNTCEDGHHYLHNTGHPPHHPWTSDVSWLKCQQLKFKVCIYCLLWVLPHLSRSLKSLKPKSSAPLKCLCKSWHKGSHLHSNHGWI